MHPLKVPTENEADASRLLRNPHVEDLRHGTLFTDYYSFLLEEEAMREFMSRIE